MINKNLIDVKKRIEAAYALVAALGCHPPRLVAVSKEKPIEMVIEAYRAGQRHFGENKIYDLLEKSTDPKIVNVCPEIRWHFIGRIQSNKIKKLTAVQNLFMVETVDSVDHANLLNSCWGVNHNDPLSVLIQVNTSGEPQKGGVNPSEVIELYRHLQQDCPNLQFKGLMCIGMQPSDCSIHPNPDFIKLVECRTTLCNKFQLPVQTVELSMGMSNDFEEAISLGSTNVRVGTTIFGER